MRAIVTTFVQCHAHICSWRLEAPVAQELALGGGDCPPGLGQNPESVICIHAVTCTDNDILSREISAQPHPFNHLIPLHPSVSAERKTIENYSKHER